MAERAFVDRIVDDEYAILLVGDDERERVIPVASLPRGAREGTWLSIRFEGGRLVEVTLDPEGEAEARRRIADKMERLRRRGRRLKGS